MNQSLIGITGYKRSGKDTAGEYFIKQGYIKYAFAGPLKKACKEIFMFTEEQTEGNDKEKHDDRWNISARKVFQRFGTEIFREKLADFYPEMENIKQNFWTYRFKIWYQNQLNLNKDVKIVVTDVRFDNEVNIIKELGGIIIKVERKNVENKDQHKSETSIGKIKYDYLVKNDSNIENYYKKLSKIGKNE
jgi:chaperonin cofactor prefoldin